MYTETSHTEKEMKHQVWKAHMKDFASHVFDCATEEERMEIDRTAGEESFVDDAVAFALRQPERFKSELVELVQNLRMATGRRLFDSVRSGGLAVDRLGNLVVMRDQEIEIDFGAGKNELGDSNYEVLTGPDAGKHYSTRTHPLKSSSRPSTIGEA